MIYKEDIHLAPRKPGIYFLFNKKKELIYIGKSKSIRYRIIEHIDNFEYLLWWIKNKRYSTSLNAKPFEYFRYTLVDGEYNRRRIEKKLINELEPKYNGWQIYYRNPKYERDMLQQLINKMR